ncbi:hypothetical protein N7478_008842 [Penicillium angulare]|uniref:uncharacterized protein n=1 Tax=Penicillium angulare TaxID=116970 RepID=UPI002540EE49|nr:uncharacterized protein N7478_008842 [Penicillium angulare]KAJ5273717.1 hypothetical protein N7478_008842 [Penicillium angulare]
MAGQGQDAPSILMTISSSADVSWLEEELSGAFSSTDLGYIGSCRVLRSETCRVFPLLNALPSPDSRERG